MKNSKTETTLEFVASNASMRARIQETQGVGLNAAASYVNRHIETGSVTRTAAAVAAKNLKWSAEDSALRISGNKGSSVRFGHVSTCGNFFLAYGVKGQGVIGLDLFGDGSKGGAIKIVSVAEIAKLALKGEELVFSRSADSHKFAGRLIGSLGNAVATLVYGAKDGRLLVVDVETDANNAHNAHVRGACGGEEKDALALSQAVMEAVASGKATRKGKTAVKAQGKKGKGK